MARRFALGTAMRHFLSRPQTAHNTDIAELKRMTRYR
jgi:hypothetical protein